MPSFEALDRVSPSRCRSTMAALAARYRSLYCGAAGATHSAEACSTIARITRSIERLDAEETVREADRSGGGRARAVYLSAGERYRSIWERYHRDACRAGQAEACSRGDEVLYNAARAFHAARDFTAASAARRTLADPQFHLSTSTRALKALYEEGWTQQAIGEYGAAADWYERFAKAAPKEAKASRALLEAVALRLALRERRRRRQRDDVSAPTQPNVVRYR